MDAIRIPVSFGEILDKMTILEIKAARVEDVDKLANIRRELRALRAVWAQHSDDTHGAVSELAARLKETNLKLWVVEDEIRDCECRNDFGEHFVRLARSVYKTNDERAAIKSEINRILGSPLREEKSYKSYRFDRAVEDRSSDKVDAENSDEASKFAARSVDNRR